MKKNAFFSFRKGDFFAIGVVVLLAISVALAFLPGDANTGESAVQIYHEGRLIRELPLGTDGEVEIVGDYHNLVQLKDGRAAIVRSDCPGGDCGSSGWIASPGRSIACLPNRVEIRITGVSDVDFVVG